MRANLPVLAVLLITVVIAYIAGLNVGLSANPCAVCPPCRESNESSQTLTTEEAPLKQTLASSQLQGTYFTKLHNVRRQQILQALPPVAHLLPGPEKALFLTRTKTKGDSWEDISQNCKEIDLVMTGKINCVALLQNTQFQMPYYIYRYVPVNESVTPRQWKPLSRVKRWEKALPQESAYQAQMQLVKTLLNQLQNIEQQLSTMIQARRNVVVVLCINHGNLDLVYNLAASTRKNNINTSNWIVFGADAEVVKAVEFLGFAAIFDESFGNLPPTAAKGYGDTTFTKMMWLKIISVYLVHRMGYHVLFQDADLVWFKDPIDYLQSPEFADYDSLWMDDGARSERYTPFYGNTGFYFLKNTDRGRAFMQEMLFSNHLVLTHHSHQSVVSKVMADHISLFGHKFRLLSWKDFPSGRVYHHEKEFMKKISSGEYVPFVFHMCWTANHEEKLRYMKEASLWFLERLCPDSNVDCLQNSSDAL